jgi:ElaB/YqjD/DUF883 family membrane-anchored ribosome-binding protein
MTAAGRVRDPAPPAAARNGDDRSTVELERDIDRIRSQMDDTIAQLEQRLSPNRLIDQVFDRMKGGPGAFAANLERTVRRHPIPAVMFAAGMGWLLFAERGDKSGKRPELAKRPRMKAGPPPTPPRFVPMRQAPQGMAIRPELAGGPHPEPPRRRFGIIGRISHRHHSNPHHSKGDNDMTGYRSSSPDWQAGGNAESGGRVGSRLGSLTHAGREQMGQVGHLAREQVDRARTGFEHMLQEQPLVLGAVAVALGAVLGATLPTSRIENRYLGPSRDELQNRAGEFAREQWEKAKQVAVTAGSAARDEAEREGLTPERLYEGAREKLGNVARAATDAAQRESGKGGGTGS